MCALQDPRPGPGHKARGWILYLATFSLIYVLYEMLGGWVGIQYLITQLSRGETGVLRDLMASLDGMGRAVADAFQGWMR
jgi:hypothetical protein